MKELIGAYNQEIVKSSRTFVWSCTRPSSALHEVRSGHAVTARIKNDRDLPQHCHRHTLPSVRDSGRIMFPSLEILANTAAVSHKILLVTIIWHLALKSWEKWQFLVSSVLEPLLLTQVQNSSSIYYLHLILILWSKLIFICSINLIF